MRLQRSVSLALVVTACSSPALAQQSAEKAASAQTLFDEGLRLMNAGQLASTCPKAAASQEFDPGMGTKFRLAECYEKVGKTASAWVLFIGIGDEARSAKRLDSERIAHKRADNLALKLARMTVLVAPDSVNLAGLEVRRYGTVLDKAVYGVAMPIDPGKHFLTVTAPGKARWESKPVAVQASKTVEAIIFRFENKPEMPLTTTLVPVATADVEKRSVVLAVILGGVVLIKVSAGGAVLGVEAGKKGDVAGQILSDTNACIAAAGAGSFDSRCNDLKSQRDSTYMLQNISGVTVAIGGAAAIAAVTYVFLPALKSKKEHTQPLTVVPVTGREQSGVVVSGTF